MDLAVRLACEGQLAVIMQQNAKQHAIANMHFRPMCSELMGKISVAGSVYAVSAAVSRKRELSRFVYCNLRAIDCDNSRFRSTRL